MLCFSRMDQPQRVTFLVGDFDGERFTPESVQHPAVGPNFYAPQSFLDPQGRRLVLGWMTPWGAPEDPDPVRSGCLTVPLEVTLDDAGTLCLFPVEEADSLLQKEDPCLRQGGVAVPDHRREKAAAGAPRPGGVGRPGAGGHPHQRGVHQRRGAVLLLLPGARCLPGLSENERGKSRPQKGRPFCAVLVQRCQLLEQALHQILELSSHPVRRLLHFLVGQGAAAQPCRQVGDAADAADLQCPCAGRHGLAGGCSCPRRKPPPPGTGGSPPGSRSWGRVVCR